MTVEIVAVFVILSVVGAAIGYTTKWTSVQLIFRPARFIGVGPIGWQGVVQRRSPKFAAGVAGTLRAVLPIEEVLDRIGPDELAQIVAEALGPRLDRLVPVVVDEIAPGMWENAPEPVRDMLGAVLRTELAAAVAELVALARPTVAEHLDLEALVVPLLSGENADRLARLIQTIGARELRAVIRYGAVVGFFVGLAEAVLYLAFDRWWILPVIGALDGLVNNWMGIQMIFRPLERRRYFGIFPYQGLFPARQAQIAHDYGHMMAAEVLTPSVLAEHFQDSAAGDGVLRLAREVFHRRLSAQLELLGPALGIDVTPEVVDRIVDTALAAASGESIDLDEFPAVIKYLDEQLQIAATIQERLESMDKLEFEGILRGIFEDDEPMLIGIGGVIGALIGSLQAVLVLSLDLGHP